MKIPFLPRPSREELSVSPLHVIVRDFPETLVEFQRRGVSLEDAGHVTPAELDDATDLLDGLEASTAWRPRPAAA